MRWPGSTTTFVLIGIVSLSLAQACFAGTNCGGPGEPACTGACCTYFTGCVNDQSQTDCEANGDDYLGDETTCGPSSCNGACCRIDTGDCVETGAQSCSFAPGEFQGIGTICLDIQCPFGACCEGADGVNGCSDRRSNGSVWTDGGCTATGGAYLGDGSTCASSTDTCPTGACCLSSGACQTATSGPGFPVHFTETFCEAEGGNYLGDETTCGPSSCDGACCRIDTGDCVETGAQSCSFAPGEFQGIGTICLDIQCPFGACCEGADGVNGCSDRRSNGSVWTDGGCTATGGTYLGDGSTCASSTDTCPTGACCLSSGACQTATSGPGFPVHFTETFCEAEGGNYLGDETTCGPSSCDGACCRIDTGDCVETGAQSCSFAPGEFQGIGTICLDIQCPFGACCEGADGVNGCSDRRSNGSVWTDGGCTATGGTYLGDGSTCASSTDTCPTGACCLSSGACQTATSGPGFPVHFTETFCEAEGGNYLGDATVCNGETCEPGACCFECDCETLTETECVAQGATFQGVNVDCQAVECDTVPPELTCPDPITMPNGARICNNRVDGWESDFNASDNCSGALTITSDLAPCGAPPGQTTTVTWEATDAAGNMASCTSDITVAPARITSTSKGSLLAYSKVEIKWSADGSQLLQDTFLDVTNDYPQDVIVQAYFVNGDTEREELFVSGGGLIQSYEPGWNTADCLFELTGNQPHYWSAARGSEKCQPFTVLDEEGPGRSDPKTAGATRILRGYVVMWAVSFGELAGHWQEIQWNHLKGDAIIVNYEKGTAWEYNAWAAQARCGDHSAPLTDCILIDLAGTCCDTVNIPSRLDFDGFQYDFAPASLVLDFYASGSTVLSGGGESVMVDTDLTLHAVSADFRQDGCGPVLTKVEAEIWNEFESKFSGTRRCICCWDQTMLSDWVRSTIVPNHFLREALRTDKGKARLDGVEGIECDYEELCGVSAKMKRWNNCFDADIVPGVAGFANGIFNGSEDAAILGLATKFLAFSPSGRHESAGMNLIGAGTEAARIQWDLEDGPSEFREDMRDRSSEALRSDHR